MQCCVWVGFRYAKVLQTWRITPASKKTSRRTFITQTAGTAIASCLPTFPLDAGGAVDRKDSGVVIEDSKLQIAFDRGSGALTGLLWKPANWTIHRRPELGFPLVRLRSCWNTKGWASCL
jgi:hypothetical protein